MLCERSQSKATWTYQKSHLGPNPGTRILCEHAQSKRTWTFHKRFHKSHFVWKFKGKVPGPNPGAHVLNGNLQEKNAHGHFRRAICLEIYRKNAVHGFRDPHSVEIYEKNAQGHFTRAILCGNLQEKLNTGPLFGEKWEDMR